MGRSPSSGKPRGSSDLALLVLSLGVAIWAPNVVKEGMQMDGLVHAAVSRNLALGVGTFWAPQLDDVRGAVFHEHPPLVFGLQGALFRLFGDHLFVERVYATIVLALTVGLLVATWRELLRGRPRLREQWWLPLLLWLVDPLNVFSFANNMLDATMGVFTLGSVWLLLGATRADAPTRAAVVRTALAGVLIVLGFLAKGPFALFPLAFFPARWASALPGEGLAPSRIAPVHERRLWVLLLGTVAAAFALLLLDTGARTNLSAYFGQQILPSLRGERFLGGGPSHAGILASLAVHVLIPAVPAALLAWLGGRPGGRIDPELRRTFLLLLLVGLAASVPIAASAKQSFRYLLVSLPYFALAFAVLASPAAERLAGAATRLRLGGPLRAVPAASAALLLFTAANLATQGDDVKGNRLEDAFVNVFPPAVPSRPEILLRGVRRERELVRDVRLIGARIGEGATVWIDEKTAGGFVVPAYLRRYFRTRFHGADDREWAVAARGGDGPGAAYREVPLPTARLVLYRRVPGAPVAAAAARS